MDEFRWNSTKSRRLKRARGASFDELLSSGDLLRIREHPHRENQQIMFIFYKGYVWLIPYVIYEGSQFLKTLYPSRKYTKLYQERKL